MQEPGQSVRENFPSRYGGYYTGRVLRRKEQQWGELRFGASSSLLTTTAEGRAFRRNHKLYVTVAGGTSRTVVRTEGARRYEGRDVVGHVSFIPAERENHGLYKGQILSCLSLEIPPSWVTKFLDGRDASAIEFLPVTNQFDPLIFDLMIALQDEAEVGGPAGRLFAETSAALLCLHLIRRYSNLGGTFKAVNPEKIARGEFERTFEFIEEHLGKKLPLDKLAEVTDMSASSFVRGFRVVTKMSPHRYILQRRIRRAQDLLRDSNRPIAEIAYDLGFSSQSHFSTVFRAFAGDSPARFRQRVSEKS
jgi:AraC family transcriptional regulator